MLSEPQERVRELVGDEGDRLEAATREDLLPFFDFVRESGLRKKECYLLRWNEVNWATKQIVKLGKGRKQVVVSITQGIRSILEPLQGHDGQFVFTYVCQRTRNGRIMGQRYTLTLSGVNTAWKRLRKKAGVVGFRFHDFRHDFGSKLLRKTHNLKLVAKALNHSDLSSTWRYAHVLDDEVAAAMESLSQDRQASREAVPAATPVPLPRKPRRTA